VNIILDAEGLSLHQVSYLTPNFAKMLLEFLQKCLPIRLKSIHIINQSLFFNVAFAIFKPFIEVRAIPQNNVCNDYRLLRATVFDTFIFRTIIT
jgi:hypothetical protein